MEKLIKPISTLMQRQTNDRPRAEVVDEIDS